MAVSFHHRRLRNGLTIVAEVDPSAATAAAGFYVRTGARDESARVMGVSHFLEHMMFKGTEEIGAEELNRRFDAMGARNNAFTSNEVTCFYAHVLPEYLGEAADLLGRMLRPALRASDFDTEKGVILEEIAMYKDQPFWVLYEACTEKHFGEHPLSHRVLGTTESITALKRDEMQSYFDERYSADNTVVALAGRMDFERVAGIVESRCGGWKRTGARRDTRPVRPAGGRVELRDAKVSRAYMLALCEAPSVSDDRRYAAMLLSQLLGAPDNSLLHWALIETGKAEEAQVSFSPHDGFGEYFVFASGDPERAEEVWEEVEHQLAGLMDGIREEDLERLRNKLATSAALGAERPNDRMHRLGQSWTYRGEYRPLEEDLARIEAVTLEDLHEVHAAYPIRAQTFGRLMPK